MPQHHSPSLFTPQYPLNLLIHLFQVLALPLGFDPLPEFAMELMSIRAVFSNGIPLLMNPI